MNELVQYINQLAGGNQVLSGFVGAWFLGVATWVLRNVPLRILQRLKVALVVTLRVNAIEGENTSRGDDTIATVTRWLLKHGWAPSLRNFRAGIDGHHTLSTGSTIWFIWRRRLMWATVGELNINNGTKHVVIISALCLGNANDLLTTWYKEVKRTDPAPEGFNTAQLVSADSWGNVRFFPALAPKRELTSLPVDENVKERLLSAIGGLIERRQWFIDNRCPRKLVILASGAPGCGKTSLGMALANEFKLPINIVTNNAFNPMILRGMIANAAGKEIPTFILIDDIDCREELKSRELKKDQDAGMTISNGPTIGLADYLAVFGGSEPMDNVIIFMTTNHPEKLDPAFRRAGRIDINIDLQGTTPAQQYEFALKRWPELAARIEPGFFVGDCVAADLFGVLSEARWDSEKAYGLLNELRHKQLQAQNPTHLVEVSHESPAGATLSSTGTGNLVGSAGTE